MTELGPEACTKGFFCMSDDWFTQNVFQVVALREFIPKDLVRLYDNPNAPVTELVSRYADPQRT